MAAIVAAVAVVYRNAAGGYFFQDDFQWLAGTLTYRPSQVFDLAGRTHFYRPMIEMYFWTFTAAFDGSPRLFHIANVLLHVTNGLLLFLLAAALTRNTRFAFTTALVFVVLPGYVEAVTWISALAEPVGAFWGCVMLYSFLRFRTGGSAAWWALSAFAFILALVTHESSVVFLLLLLLADWAFFGQARPLQRAIVDTARLAAPYAAAIVLYLAIDFSINAKSYVVEEGYYRLGLHAVPNVLGYIVWLYVGRRNVLSYVLIAAALVALVVFGTRRVRFAVCWMLLALMPFAFFTWGNTSRYLYLPAMGFAMLVAEGIEWLDGRLSSRMSRQLRQAVIALLIAGVTVRFAAFASRGVSNFSERTEAYRRFAHDLRQRYPQLAPYGTVPIDRDTESRLTLRYLEGLVRWEYRDPTLRVVVRE
jgi:hypothetical protein